MPTYIIERGETPAIVAAKFGVSKEDLFRANPHLPVVTDRFGHREVYKGYWDAGNRINLPVSGAVGAPSGSVGGTCAGTTPFGNPPRQCVDSEYDVNAWCIQMCLYIKPRAEQAGFASGYGDGLRGYSGQYVVPSPPDEPPFAFTVTSNIHSAPDLFMSSSDEWSTTTEYPCTYQLWDAWKTSYMVGYDKGHARGTQERQANQSGVANSLADVAKAWQQAQRDAERTAADNAEIARRNAEAVSAAGAAAIRHAAQPGRATNYGPFTGRRG